MAKKNSTTSVPTDAEEHKAIEDEGSGEMPEADGGFQFDTSFNAEEEYKIAPLVPNGEFNGMISAVRFSPAECALVWEITLQADSDVLMSDQETPVNGNILLYKNWFPRSGDENIRTKTGKMTKRQAKINMIAEFQKHMKINMNTPEDIVNGVTNAEWIGLEVTVEVEVREYEGRLSNQIRSMKAA